MRKYNLTGIVTKTIDMEVEAKNLQDAINKCYKEYNFEEIDEESAILVDGKILEDGQSEIYLCDIPVADRIKY